MAIYKLPIGTIGARIFDVVTQQLGWMFHAFSAVVIGIDSSLRFVLLAPPALLWIAVVTALSWYLLGTRFAVFSLASLLLLLNQELWVPTMITLSLVLTSTLVALIIAFPLGVLMAESRIAHALLEPALDFIQTMPRFVYLIPAIILLGIDIPPAVFATLTLAVVPPIRAIATGLSQVNEHLVEAARAYGANRMQLLVKVKFPLAVAPVMLGVNQCIMMSLSMVVIASLIGASGLGTEILHALSSLDAGQGFVASFGIFVLAVLLDRMTRAAAEQLRGSRHLSGNA